ncbi:MAG: hypothetical protein GKR93_12530 [Gammaproteobacteria bacterium]|nr:hypothetical protein [Gammaproteobacteria bacterium]
MRVNPHREQHLLPEHRVSPYFPVTEELGWEQYTVFNHMITPTLCKHISPQEVYEALTTRAILIPTGAERQVEVTGKDAVKFMDYLVTRDMNKLSPGRCSYTFVCDEDGELIVDGIVIYISEEKVWYGVTDGDVELWARGIALHSDYDVQVREADVAPLQIQGPKSRDILRAIVGESIDELKFFRCMEAVIAGVDCVVSRTGWTGELGYEVYPIGSDRALDVWDVIIEAGKPHDMLVSGLSWGKALESGLMVFSMGTRDEHMNPLEHWRSNLVDLEKGPFIGQEALRKITENGGPTRKVVGLIGSEEALSVLERPCKVRYEKSEIGVTRSLGFSPTLKRNICLALVDQKYTKEGTKLVLEHPDGAAEMEVTEVPFVDKKGLRVRS